MRRPQRVLGYCRVSGAEQGRTGTSLQAQREEIERYCAASGLPAPRLYVEVESAGAEKLDRRRILQGLMSDARAGDLVIVSKQDRWSRDTLFYLKSTEELVGRGVAFFSIAERFDPTTPEGKFAATVMAAVAEHERARIWARTVGRRRQLRDQGCYIEGLPPIGYERGADRHLVVRKDEAPIVRFIFGACIRGRSLSEIAAECRVRWPERSSWDKSTVLDLLRNRHLLGEVRMTDNTWMKGAHEPLVDAGTFERASRSLVKRRVGGRTPWGARTDQWLLRGLMSCTKCGRRFGPAYSSGQGNDYYACGGRIRRLGCEMPYARVDRTDELVSALVLERLAGLRAELSREPTGEEKAATIDFRVLRARIEKRRERFIDMRADGAITRDELRQKLAAIEADLAQLSQRQEEQQVLARATSKQHRRALLSDVQKLQRMWGKASVPDRRRIVGELVEAITLTPDREPVITWKPLAQLVWTPGGAAGGGNAGNGGDLAIDHLEEQTYPPPRLICLAKVASEQPVRKTHRRRRVP